MRKLLPASFRNILFFLALVLGSFASRASHIVGGDLYYTWISGNDYRITVVLYGDCAGSAFPTLSTGSPHVCVYNGTTPITELILTPDAVSAAGGTEITPVCIDSIGHTQCTILSSATPGIKKFTYSKVYTLPGTSANYRFIFNGAAGSSTAGRNATITNIASPGSTVTQLIDTLNNTLGPNTSPILTVVPTPFFATTVPNCYTPGAIDPDLDSLTFDLIPATEGLTNCTTVGGPETYTGFAWPGQPVTGSTPITTPMTTWGFDASNGQVCFNTPTTQRSVVVFNIREYRGGIFVGSCQREMTFLIRDFPNSPPSAGAPTVSGLTIEDNTHFHVCGATGPFSFSLSPTETGSVPHNITCSASGLGTSGLVFTVLNNNTFAPVCTITGDATLMAPGIYNFFITIRDDGCPISNITTIPYRIQIYPVPTVSIIKISDADCVHGAVVKITPGSLTGGTSGSPWIIKTIDSTLVPPGGPADTIESHTASGAYYDTLSPHSILPGSYSGSYYFTVYSSVSNQCSIYDSIKLLAPPQLQPYDSAISPSYCGANNGFIVVKNLNPAGVDTVTFNDATGTAVSQIQIVNAMGEITIGSLVSGAYSNMVIHYGYCTSDVLPTQNLVDSPFHYRDILTTDATKCGYCDGIIKIRGLHPTQIDSVSYSYTSPITGVTQFDTVAYYVGIDSTIIMPALCKGAYNTFTIWTQTSHNCLRTPTTVANIGAPGISAGFDTVVHLGCHGDTIMFNNTSSPASDLHYSWLFGDGSTSDLASPTHAYTNTNNNTITAKLFISNGFCLDSAKIDRTFNNLVGSDFSMDPPTFLCQQQDTLHFTNLSSGTSPRFLWIYGDGATDTATTPYHIFPRAGTYNVMFIAKNFVPCADTMIRTITVDSLGPVTMNVTSSSVCRGQSINYSAIYPNSGNVSNMWRFSDGFSMNNMDNFNHAFEGTGDFTVDLSTQFRACPEQTTSHTFKVYDYPSLYIGPDMTICTGSNPIELKDQRNAENPKASWAWNTNETTAGITVVKPGDYIASVTIDGCTTSDTVSVVKDCYMDIPNVFTPNGDGINDYFFPRGTQTKGLITFKMNIYNRWGQLIYETATTDGKGWDGALNGVPQPAGVYVYAIDATYKDGQIEHHTGNVTVLK